MAPTALQGERLSIGTDGPGVLFHTVTTMIEADLRPALGGRRGQYRLPAAAAVVHDPDGPRRRRAPLGVRHRLRPEHGESLEGFTLDERVGMVRAAAGLPDVAVSLRPQIPDTDLKVLGFLGRRAGRAALPRRAGVPVGDVAKIVPPTGGLGAATGSWTPTTWPGSSPRS